MIVFRKTVCSSSTKHIRLDDVAAAC